MKKTFLLSAALGIVLLCGCGASDASGVSDYGSALEKAQQISVLPPGADEVACAITDPEEIGRFVQALEIDEWTLTSLPEGADEIGSFGLSQEKTVTLDQTAPDEALYDVGTLTLYDGSCVGLEIAGLEMAFEISETAADYLNGYFEP